MQFDKLLLADGMGMENIENLAHLESAVDKLLNAVKEMKQEKLELEARLDSRDQELENLKQQLQALLGERSQVEQRVTGLLSSIDKWEELQNSADVVDETTEGAAEGNTLF